MLFRLLAGVAVNASSHKSCVSLSNQKWNIQPTLTNLHPIEYSQELQYVFQTKNKV